MSTLLHNRQFVQQPLITFYFAKLAVLSRLLLGFMRQLPFALPTVACAWLQYTTPAPHTVKHNTSYHSTVCSSSRGHCLRYLGQRYFYFYFFFSAMNGEKYHCIDVLEEQLLTYFYVSHSGTCVKRHNSTEFK